MIEKLDSKMDCVEITVLGKHTECLGFDSAKEIGKKLNELVDAVNALVYEHDKDSDWYDGQTRADNVQPDAESRSGNVQDTFAEQRKWIGTLCKFRDKDYKDDQWDYGLLQAVEKAETAHIWKTGCFKHNLGHWYDYCEPVLPTDNAIYKGGDNE